MTAIASKLAVLRAKRAEGTFRKSLADRCERHALVRMSALVPALKAANQDHEFYPTTDEILAAVVQDIKRTQTKDYLRYTSALDIGAGHGKVLRALRDKLEIKDLYAIEKSEILCQQLDEDILIVGTEFHEQSLFSKKADIIFCNPPYSEFEAWAEKIIRQCNGRIYLVIPERWESSVPIADALRFRSKSARKLGEFDFEDAEDRKARAKVHLLCIPLGAAKERYRDVDETEWTTNDPFELFFREQFADLIAKYKATEPPPLKEDEKEKRGYGGRHRPFHDLEPGPNYPDAMVGLYNSEIANVERNYQLVSALDAALLREFEITPAKIMALLHSRLDGLRMEYWKELFDKLNAITSRLTSQSRSSLVGTLNNHVHVDFTVSNIFAIIIWAIKNANRFIDSQLIATYDLMVAKCNVRLYKSNKRTWEEERWRYNSEPRKNSHFALDYRIVTAAIGGIETSSWSSCNNGLSERAATFLGDLLTIASNLGFRTDEWQRGQLWGNRGQWIPGELRTFRCLDPRNDSSIVLFDVRAFKNGNLHLRFNQKFILALNVEHGRLKGWIHSAEEAAVELQDPDAAHYFHANLQLSNGDAALLLT